MGAARARLAVAAAFLVSACATPVARVVAPSPAWGELGRTDSVIVVAAAPGDTPGRLAERYLHDPSLSGRVMKVPPASDAGGANDGRLFAIARRPIDPANLSLGAARRVPILCYHRFTAQRGQRSRLDVVAADFDAQLGWLHDNGYVVVPLRRVAEFLQGQADLPEHAVAITIDDGYRSALSLAAPLLRQRGMPATLFVYSDFIGSRDGLSWSDLATLEAEGLIAVEAHSKSHADLTARTRGETPAAYQRRLQAELTQPRDMIERKGSAKPMAFAYPYGAADGGVRDATAKAGWRLGLTVVRGGNPVWSDPLLLRRDMVFGTDSLSDFARRVRAAEAPGRRR